MELISTVFTSWLIHKMGAGVQTLKWLPVVYIYEPMAPLLVLWNTAKTHILLLSSPLLPHSVCLDGVTHMHRHTHTPDHGIENILILSFQLPFCCSQTQTCLFWENKTLPLLLNIPGTFLLLFQAAAWHKEIIGKRKKKCVFECGGGDSHTSAELCRALVLITWEER